MSASGLIDDPFRLEFGYYQGILHVETGGTRGGLSVLLVERGVVVDVLTVPLQYQIWVRDKICGPQLGF